jgi:hypothetical protein
MGNYEVLIDGTLHSWNKETISVPEIRELGGLPADCPVVKVDLTTNAEQTLGEGDVHELVPLDTGKPVVKRIGFKQG